jgi:hypothetical protein
MCPWREERWPDAKKMQPAGGKRDEAGLAERRVVAPTSMSRREAAAAGGIGRMT